MNSRRRKIAIRWAPAAIIALLPAAIVFSWVGGSDDAGFLANSRNPAVITEVAPTSVASISDEPVVNDIPFESVTFTVQVSRENQFVWPALGGITTYFGLGHPNGIDIGLSPDDDSPILSSAAGVVSETGGNPCCSYGYFVVVDHDSGMSTLYGHLSEILVTAGQNVEQGEILGLGGATGEADGKHLHFELRAGGQPVDPLRYLSVPDGQVLNDVLSLVNCSFNPILIGPASRLTLRFVSTGTADPQIEGVSFTTLSAGPFATPPNIRSDGPLEVAVNVPPLITAAGQTALFDIEAVLLDGGQRQTVTCRLDLRAMKTLPNPPVVRANVGPPTPTPTPTFEHPRRPTSTPKPQFTSTPIRQRPVFRTPTPVRAASPTGR